MTVYCSTCDHVSPRTRDLDGWRWRCLAYPRADDPHFLGPGVRAREPHDRCADRNVDGECPKWTPRREKANV